MDKIVVQGKLCAEFPFPCHSKIANKHNLSPQHYEQPF